MSPFQTIKESLAAELVRLNDLIKSSLSSDNALMNEVITTYLRSTGKQIRPIIVMLCAKMFGEINQKVLDAAASVEILHNASLIHDDVVDDTKLRRNNPTLNALWDNRISVLVGDFFVTVALHRALDTDDMRIIREVGSLGKQLTVGEMDQIYNARQHALTEEAYFKVINAKTASLFVTCARLGCFAVEASEADTEKLSEVAHLLGLCFQIRDDIFDYFDAEEVGKPTGNDLREGKVSLPLLHALLNPASPGREAMLELVSHEELSDDEIATLTAFARNNGGIDYAYSRMAQMRTRAAEILASFSDNPQAKSLLEIFDYIIARKL